MGRNSRRASHRGAGPAAPCVVPRCPPRRAPARRCPAGQSGDFPL